MFYTVNIKMLLSAFILSLTIHSCSSLENDVEKYGRLYCKTEKIAQQMISGEISLEEGKEKSEKLNKEIQSLKKEMEEKYKSPEEINKLNKTFSEVADHCE